LKVQISQGSVATDLRWSGSIHSNICAVHRWVLQWNATSTGRVWNETSPIH